MYSTFMTIEKISKSLFYLVALWCVAIGAFNLTISGTSDFPWIAEALEGTDVSKFDPIMAVWGHWIGLFLITAGISLYILTRELFISRTILLATSVLSVGTIAAQLFSALSLGASGPIFIVGPIVFLCSVGGPVLGFLYLRGRDT